MSQRGRPVRQCVIDNAPKQKALYASLVPKKRKVQACNSVELADLASVQIGGADQPVEGINVQEQEHAEEVIEARGENEQPQLLQESDDEEPDAKCCIKIGEVDQPVEGNNGQEEEHVEGVIHFEHHGKEPQQQEQARGENEQPQQLQKSDDEEPDPKCCIEECNLDDHPGGSTTLFKFPDKDENSRMWRIWTGNVRFYRMNAYWDTEKHLPSWEPNAWTLLCSSHFARHMFRGDDTLELVEDAVPTIFPPTRGIPRLKLNTPPRGFFLEEVIIDF